MQEWSEAIIVGFGYKPSSPDELRLLSADITEGGPKRNLGTEALSRGTGSSNPFPSSRESQRTFGTARSGPPMAHPGQHVHRGAAIDHPQPTHDPTGVIDT
jgi:hypothetical protein